MKLILRALKYVFLAPFIPLKVFRDFEEQSSQAGIAMIAFFFGLICCSGIVWFFAVYGGTEEASAGFGNTFIFFIINLFDVFVFLMVFMIGVAVSGGDFGGFYSLFILMGLILLPQTISFVASMYLDYEHVYVDWLSTFWQMVIVSMGIWVRHVDNLTKASIIAVLGVLAVHGLDQVLFLV